MKFSLKTVVALILIALSALAIWWIIRLIWLRPSDIDLFYSRSFYDLYDEDPEYLSLVAPPIAGRISTYPSSMNNPLPERILSQRRKAIKLLKQLQGYSQVQLSPEQQQTYAFLEALLKNMASGEAYSERVFLFTPHSGLHSRLPAFLTYVPVINNREEATAFLERVRALPVLINMALKACQDQVAAGYIPSASVIDRSLEEIDAFLAMPPNQNPLYLGFASRAARVAQLYPTLFNENQAVESLMEIETFTETRVYPSYRKVKAYLESVRSQAAPEPGIWQSPQGDDYYRYCLQTYAGTDLPPDSLFSLGNSELQLLKDRLEAEVNLIGEEYPGNCGAYFETLPRADSFDLTTQGRMIQAQARELIIGAIEKIPAAGKLEFRPELSYREGSSPRVHYQEGAMAEDRAAIIFYQASSLASWQWPSLVYHFASPGTDLQQKRIRAREDLPLIRRVGHLPASEGWGLYAEQLADELGLYKIPHPGLKDGLYAQMGYLQSHILQTVYLVIDPGIHHLKWSRAQAIDFVREWTGISEEEAAKEVDFVSAHPGKTCASKTGQLKILALKARMQEALGTNFALQDFHHLFLESGSLPYPDMEKVLLQK